MLTTTAFNLGKQTMTTKPTGIIVTAIALWLSLFTVVSAEKVIPVTENFTDGVEWPEGESIKGGSINKASGRAVVEIDDGASGVIMESGQAFGFALYIYNGKVYFQCGKGHAFPTAGQTVIGAPIDPGRRVIEWSANASLNKASLYIDGKMAGKSDQEIALWVENGEGGAGQAFGKMVANAGHFDADNSKFTGKIYSATYYPQKTLHKRMLLDTLFMDHMVLQRGREIPVFGETHPANEVTVRLGDATKICKSDAVGKWRVVFEPRKENSNPTALTVSAAGETVEVKDILFGDVWLCTGQSNMDTGVNSYGELKESLKDTGNPLVRLFVVNYVISDTPQTLVNGAWPYELSGSAWKTAMPDNFGGFSAVGMCFGLKMQQELNIPIGLVHCAMGATAVEAWMPAESFAAMEGGYTPMEVVKERNQPSVLYNGMFHPLLPMKYKGIIWYQGEQNAKDFAHYGDRIKMLITVWREKLRQPDLPFYYALLAPFGREDNGLEEWAWMREAQDKALELPSTAHIVLSDLGEYKWIHPADKRPVGERFARVALKGMGAVDFAGFPKYRDHRIETDQFIITFDNAGKSLRTQKVIMNKEKGKPVHKDPEAFVVEANSLAGFEICGPDGVFLPAKADIVAPDKVKVWNPEIQKPVAVRYAWKNFPLCNLYNSDGMPAAPFRTDYSPNTIACRMNRKGSKLIEK